jgi:alpha-ribazole phosphatase
MRRIYLVRHGDVGLSGDDRHYVGQTDLRLSAEGLCQARRLGQALSEVPLSAVYCSDLTRSVETARIIAEPHGLCPVVRRDLREIYLGEWEGLAFGDVRRRYPREFEDRGRDIVHYRPPGGESFLDCSERVMAALGEILVSGRGEALIVGHAGVNRIVLCHVLGISLEKLFSIGQDPGCLSVLRLDEAGYRLERLNAAPPA